VRLQRVKTRSWLSLYGKKCAKSKIEATTTKSEMLEVMIVNLLI
jgi:hypothetical protein